MKNRKWKLKMDEIALVKKKKKALEWCIERVNIEK